jgi:uncharacterized protein YbaP (TraB family)
MELEEKIEDILISVKSLKKEIKNTRHIFRLESIEKDVKMLSALHKDEIFDLIESYIPELIMEDTNE